MSMTCLSTALLNPLTHLWLLFSLSWHSSLKLLSSSEVTNSCSIQALPSTWSMSLMPIKPLSTAAPSSNSASWSMLSISAFQTAQSFLQAASQAPHIWSCTPHTTCPLLDTNQGLSEYRYQRFPSLIQAGDWPLFTNWTYYIATSMLSPGIPAYLSIGLEVGQLVATTAL